MLLLSLEKVIFSPPRLISFEKSNPILGIGWDECFKELRSRFFCPAAYSKSGAVMFSAVTVMSNSRREDTLVRVINTHLRREYTFF